MVVVLLGSIGTSDSVRPTYHHYVAMGDSYTAAPFVPLTDVAYGCFRSSNNYPKLVADGTARGRPPGPVLQRGARPPTSPVGSARCAA